MYAHKCILYLHIATNSPALCTGCEHNIMTVTHKLLHDIRCICTVIHESRCSGLMSLADCPNYYCAHIQSIIYFCILRMYLYFCIH